MNKFYVILPVILLIIFGVYYTKVAEPQMEAQARAEEQRIVEQQAADDARRKEIELKAQEDARKAQAARNEKERQRQEKARLDKEEQDRKISEETAKYENEADRLTKEIADLDVQITNLRNQREAMNREVLESSKKVELAKIDRRTAELEIQRMYDIVAQKVAESSLAQMPPPPPAK
ncbi:MAG: hypothetical protein PHE83_07025 [Opitutaceae bacterium]|nr:hypothetical protein [Opitutaceae bacterium]